MSAETCFISHPCALFLYFDSPQSRKFRLKTPPRAADAEKQPSPGACTTARLVVQPVSACSDKNNGALDHVRDTKQVFLRKPSGLEKSYLFIDIHTFCRLAYNNIKQDNSINYNILYAF
ncbi:hypothetical protein QPR60_08500 [Enterobacter hormaechei]|uniref:Uncharacterized protein n=3 Tax=Enterobacter hormaechei TaxID=158836 RepID=A0AAX3Z6V9_9ENTR|nr:hypothetical protein [Enterobacter hormaechei]UAS96123.1 hypothetical protein K9O84_08300 [Enterobacter cloacae complex sp.]EGQ5298933.1 hypothetical protein [Enterobacter hormaechei]EJB6975247.1 hypothetical protein [Enterobacter hormaechei]EKT5039978.1 hypothetical protein [Enterobacter hormaechei]EKV4057669.1 hypothetical protein [Enterobacter hormaechei]